MKKAIIAIGFMVIGTIHAQNREEVSVRRVIDTFYEGFNQRDSVKMKLMLSKKIQYKNVEEVYGNKVVASKDLFEIIRTISAIPKTTKFRQDLNEVKINADNHIANAWITYKFYLYDAYYHCGSSSIQLAKENGDWKIISLLDNYSKEACSE